MVGINQIRKKLKESHDRQKKKKKKREQQQKGIELKRGEKERKLPAGNSQQG